MALILVTSFVMSLTVGASALDVEGTSLPTEDMKNAIYLGVKDYGTVSADDKDDFEHRFSIGGKEVTYKVSNAGNYALQNLLMEGYVYDITVENNVITNVIIPEPTVIGTVEAIDESSITVNGKNVSTTSATETYKITTQAGGAVATSENTAVGDSVKVYGDPAELLCITFVARPYNAPVSGQPGKRTLKNFLETSLHPVGTALYVYGGTWDWQDAGSSRQSTTIGLAQEWIDFFQSQDDTYKYRYNDDHSKSYYPHKGYNQYYYAGIDCSAYAAWAVYNIMNTTDHNDGYVASSSVIAKNLAEKYNYGTWTRDEQNIKDLKPGDIFSMTGHTWICIGVCDDGSAVILHSTPSDSKSKNPGGGVQISAIGDDDSCEAYSLAKQYMEKYYPEWSQKYTAVRREYSTYTALGSNPNSGKFSWNLDDSGVLDPDGYAEMSAEEVLRDLFGENSGGSSGSSGSSSGGTSTSSYSIIIKEDVNGTVTASSKSASSGRKVTVSTAANDGYELDTITVSDKNGKEVTLKSEADEKYSFIMPKSSVTITATFKKIESTETPEPTTPPTENVFPFTDVKESDWFYNAIRYTYDQKLMAGISESNFVPGQTMTRAMAVQVLYNMENSPKNIITNSDQAFTDVNSNDWFADAITWAYSKDIIKGYGNGVMGPNDPVTREQLVVMIYNYKKMTNADITKSADLSFYHDSDQISQWAISQMSWALAQGIITGRPGNILAPGDLIIRAEMAQILLNLSHE